MFAPSQWETALLCNDVSHWLDASLESALKDRPDSQWEIYSTGISYKTDHVITVWHYIAFIVTMAGDLQWNIHTHMCKNMMTSSNGNIFHVTGHLCGEFNGHRWILRTKASGAVIWDAIAPIMTSLLWFLEMQSRFHPLVLAVVWDCSAAPLSFSVRLFLRLMRV